VSYKQHCALLKGQCWAIASSISAYHKNASPIAQLGNS
jgi:hypothetical protein